MRKPREDIEYALRGTGVGMCVCVCVCVHVCVHACVQVGTGETVCRRGEGRGDVKGGGDGEGGGDGYEGRGMQGINSIVGYTHKGMIQ